MGTLACANAGRSLYGSNALEDQGLALRLTDLWQAQGGSQRGRPTRVGKLTEKRVRFGRRAPGLTFGTTMTTSSAPVALRAASQSWLPSRKYRLVVLDPCISSGRCSREPAPGRVYKGRARLYTRQGCGVAPFPAAENQGQRSAERPLSAMRSVGRFRGTLDTV